MILYLSDCDCGRKYCRERAAYLVKNQLKRVSLKDAATEFMIEYVDISQPWLFLFHTLYLYFYIFIFRWFFLTFDHVSVLNVDVNIICRYKNQGSLSGGFEINAGLIGHVHLNEVGTSFFLPNIVTFCIFDSEAAITFFDYAYKYWLTCDVLNRCC